MGDITENFSRDEFACGCGCGLDTINVAVVYALQIIRNHFDAKMTVTSGCRCTAHNRDIEGKDNSLHLSCFAADFVVSGVSSLVVADFIDTYFHGNNGLGRYNTFTHFDVRAWARSRWGR